MRDRFAWHWPSIPEKRANTSGKDSVIIQIVSYPNPQSKTRCLIEMRRKKSLRDLEMESGLKKEHKRMGQKVVSEDVLPEKGTR